MAPGPGGDGVPDVDVCVVGLGPVGATLALLLADRGHRVAVLERHPHRYVLPRAVHLDHEVARVLQSVGLGDDLGEITEPAPTYEWRNGRGDVLLRFGGRAEGPSGWPDANMFWQPALEERLERALARRDRVVVCRGVEVTGIADRGAAGVVVGGRGGPLATARFVVGCDGANSTVRSLVGAPVTELGFRYDWLIVDVAPHAPRLFDPVNLQVCDPVRPTTAVSGGPGRRRWEFMRLPGETVEELDDPATAWRLLAPWDVTPDDADLERHAVYTFGARWVDAGRWRTGRVLLAGDAAHLMPPFAGQGMCSGIRDAANLAWKLDLVLRERAGDGLLDVYGAERADGVRAAIEVSVRLGEVICVTDPEEAAARDAGLTAATADAGVQSIPPLPGLSCGIVRSGDDRAGTLFPQGWVEPATAVGTRRRLDDVVGAGWRLVVHDRTEAPPSATDRAWFEELGGRVVVVGPPGAPGAAGGDVGDADGTYGRWFTGHGVVAALQRPDFHLYGTAGPGGSAGLLADLRADLAAAGGSPSPTRATDPRGAP